MRTYETTIRYKIPAHLAAKARTETHTDRLDNKREAIRSVRRGVKQYRGSTAEVHAIDYGDEAETRTLIFQCHSKGSPRGVVVVVDEL